MMRIVYRMQSYIRADQVDTEGFGKGKPLLLCERQQVVSARHKSVDTGQYKSILDGRLYVDDDARPDHSRELFGRKPSTFRQSVSLQKGGRPW
jgi:hypothetical protein